MGQNGNLNGMGNPENLDGWPGGRPVEPPAHRVLWIVYQTMYMGKKMPPEIAKRTSKVGTLEFWRPPSDKSQLNARLWHPSGYPAIDALYNVAVVRGEPGSGLLLRGDYISVTRGVAADVPQGWWCLVHSVESLSKE